MIMLEKITVFKNVCPYLGRTKLSTLRSLSSHASKRCPSVSRLAFKTAASCPVMGPALAVRVPQLGQAAGYASVAATEDVCPHAKQAREAARMAQAFAAVGKKAESKTAAAKCPFPHGKAATETFAAPSHAKFDYNAFYNEELEKKHKGTLLRLRCQVLHDRHCVCDVDQSYRYFNNINRLAARFPVAHTGSTKEEVDVWCSNDYLGMSKNPVILDTMQYVGRRPAFCCNCELTPLSR